MDESSHRYYVVVYLAADSLWKSFTWNDPMETADEIETARVYAGEDAVITFFKRIE